MLRPMLRRRRSSPPPAHDMAFHRRPGVPAWLKLGFGVGTPVIACVYASTTLAVLTENRLLASMPAVGALPLEVAWNADFISGGRLLGLAGYMFDKDLPPGLRALSLFHVALPPTLIWMLRRFGYDRRAFLAQTALTWALLPLTYAVTKPEENTNWVFGPGREPQRRLPPLLYLALEMAVLPAMVFLPTHLLLRRLFGRGRR
jgi:hypothetical protein